MPRIQDFESKTDLSPEQMEIAAAAFNKPIPGQSLTNSPDQPYAWEQAPKYTSVPQAALAIFADLTEEENFVQLMTALKSGTSVSDITSVILYRGFQLGQFNPDMMLLLMEPVMYMILALAEKVGLGDVLGYEGEQLDEDFDEDEKEEKLTLLKDTVKKSLQTVSEQSLEGMPNIQKELLEFEPPENIQSLLGRDNQDETTGLLNRR